MSTIAHSIAQLLYTHDCVIVPHFGGFLARYQPAVADALAGEITPPRKEITFNQALSLNDGILASHLATTERISYAEALQMLETFAASCNIKLEQLEIVFLPHIGKLFFDSDKKLIFQPANTTNFLKTAYGLALVKRYPHIEKVITHTTPELVAAPETQSQPSNTTLPTTTLPPPPQIPTQQTQESSRISIPKTYTMPSIMITPQRAAIIAASILFLAVSFPLLVKYTQQKEANLAQEEILVSEPIASDNDPTTRPQSSNAAIFSGSDEKGLAYDEAPTTYIEDDKEVAQIETPEPKVTFSTPSATSSPDVNGSAYHIAIGAYSRSVNAETMAARIRKAGYSPVVTETNGLYRVAIRLRCSSSEINTKLADIRARIEREAKLTTY